MGLLGNRVSSCSGNGVVISSGCVALAQLPILPNGFQGFDIDRDPLVHQVEQVFAAFTPQEVQSILAGSSFDHKLGADTKNDELVYEEKDERFDVSVGKTRSRKYIFLQTASHTTSEVRYLDASTPTGEWKLIAPREQNVEYYPDQLGD